MEYLALVGGDLREFLSGFLGDTAPFFWSVVAPVFLAIFWLGGIYALWETWFRKPGEGNSSGGPVFKLFATVFLLALIVCSGAALEYLLLGNGHLHSRVLAGILDIVRPR
jgi:hypothetical protein